jgi:hypothetical protein
MEPATGVAANVTEFPVGKLAVQVLPQLMPLGALVTVPDPGPLLSTVRLDMATGPIAVKKHHPPHV